MHFSFLQKFGGAVLVAVWLVWGSHMIGEMVFPEFKAPKDTAAAAARPATGAKAEPDEPAEVEEIGPLLASASVEGGETVFKKCKACHTVDDGGANKVGPNLWDIVGAEQAAKDGFSYSDALVEKGGKWTYDDLNAFLARPKDYAPGTKMSFAGLKKATDRAAIIAYLRAQSENPPPLP